MLAIAIFAVGTEIHDKVVAPEWIRRPHNSRDMAQLRGNWSGIKEGLETLAAIEGLDIPDGVVDIIPAAIVIVGAARLIYSALKTEREFKAADRTTKNRSRGTNPDLMSRMGVSAVLAT